MRLDVVIIATVRPEILRMTLATFTARLFNQFDVRAFINVDPIGETDKHTPMDLVNICREYFNEVIYNIPDTPSYARAVQWGWRQVETDLFFILEDDWVLKRTANANKLLALFENDAVVNVLLNIFGTKNTPWWKEKTAKGEIMMYDGDTMHRDCFAIGPGFLRTAYIKQIVERMELDKDPEFQYEVGAKRITTDYPKPIFLWCVSPESLIIDTGKWWRRVRNMRKPGDRNNPTFWQTHQNPFYKRITSDLFRTISRKVRWFFIKRYYLWRYCRKLP